MSKNRAIVAAEHLVGNLWYQLDAVPLMAGRLEPDTMRYAVGGPAGIAYSEMCRLLRSESELLSAGALESGLRQQGFDFDWLADLQGRIAAESVETLYNYAGEINNASDLRHLEMFCGQAIERVRQPDAQADVIAADLLMKLAEANNSANDVEPISVGAQRVRQRLRDIQAGIAEYGDRTGFGALDSHFRMREGHLIIVGGRPSQGKTSLWRQIFYNRAKQIVREGDNGQVVMFSSDDTADDVIFGLACGLAQVDSRRIEQNQATGEEFHRVEMRVNELEGLPIVIDDTPGPTVDSMYYRCAMLNAQKRIRLAGQDYMELIAHPKADGDLQKVEYAARGVKGIGKTLGFSWLQLSQLRKEVDNRRDKWPTAADVKYAGEAEANVMLLIMRPEHYLAKGETCEHQAGDEENIALVNVAKNKGGSVGLVRLAFRKEYSRFYDIERQELN